MAIQERLYTVDDVWRLSQLPENELKRFYLIDGELFWDMAPGYRHGRLEILIGHHLLVHAEEHDLGEVTGEVGYYPADDRHTLLGPDVAFIRKENVPPADHEKFVPRMPDLAVEISSPSNTVAELRRKAAVYLANGTELVWLVLPEQAGVEVWRIGPDGEPASEIVARDGSLSGEQVLPGFTLDLRRLFPS
ncbi:MAG: Uma2 family endonuclease [Chloroflexota bacterium]|nr:Uma2 family endonuclease [Chloroflexota bacterium]